MRLSFGLFVTAVTLSTARAIRNDVFSDETLFWDRLLQDGMSVPVMDSDTGAGDDVDVPSNPPEPPVVASTPPSTETEEPVACTFEVLTCPDGSFVGRGGPDCEFAPCPMVSECPPAVTLCPDGTEVDNQNPDCVMAECPPPPVTLPETDAPDVVVCTMEVQACPDGSFVGRVGPDCEFAPCPTDFTSAPTEGLTFGVTDMDATSTSPEPVTFPEPEPPVTIPGPGVVACTADVQQCPDGSFVGRVAPDCAFAPCPGTLPEPPVTLPEPEPPVTLPEPEPPVTLPEPEPPVTLPEPGATACTMEVQACPDGSFVGRVGPDCEFEPCPTDFTSAPTEGDDFTDGASGMNATSSSSEPDEGPGKPDHDHGPGKPDGGPGKPDDGPGKPDGGPGKPDDDKPDDDKPGGGKPDDDKPDGGPGKPDDDKPDGGKPDGGKPDDDKPGGGKPGGGKPDHDGHGHGADEPVADESLGTNAPTDGGDDMSSMTDTFAPTEMFAPRDSMGMCASDVFQCPDGSFVARVEPDCDFAPCPMRRMLRAGRK